MSKDAPGFPGRRTLRFIAAFDAPVQGHCAQHSHPSIEIVLHRRTSGRTTLGDGRVQSFVANSVVVYPPSQTHAQDADAPGRDLCVHVSCEAPLPTSLDRLLNIPPPIAPWCVAEIASLMHAPTHPTPDEQAILDHRSTAVLAHLVLHHGSEASAPRAPALRLVERAKDILRAEYRSDCRLSDVARRLGVSPDYLRHCFTDLTGISLLAFLTEVRLERARTLLVNTNLPLAAIASDSGFATARYFCSVFALHVGVTPTAFRRRG